jgi:lysophospholipase L1-like esterase
MRTKPSLRNLWIPCWLAFAMGQAFAEASPGNLHWVGTWSTAQQRVEPANLPPSPGLAGNTLRQIVHVTSGGTCIRIRISNEFGTSQVTLKQIHCAASAGGASIDAKTDKALTFRGKASVTLGAGEIAVSDPVDFALIPLSNLALTIHFGTISEAVTGHPGSRTTSFIENGNAVSAPDMPTATKTDHWYFAAGIDVLATRESRAIVALGDSITDGRGSTTNGNDRWTDVLAHRLQQGGMKHPVSVLNLGIGGNAVLSGGLGPTAQTRFERDVFDQSGAQWLILLEGVNDIGASRDPGIGDRLIAAYQQFVQAAHKRQIKVYGVPILPFKASGYDSAEHEAARQQINAWIRVPGHFDAVIDLDAAVRDPLDPARLLPAYDCGDHLHLSPAGYQKMGQAIDLALFKASHLP